MFHERVGEPLRIEEVALDERTPANEIALAGGVNVVHCRQEPAGGQPLAGVAADVSGAAGDEGDRARDLGAHLRGIPVIFGERGTCESPTGR